MVERRRRGTDATLTAAFLLLPALPEVVQLVGDAGAVWSGAADHWDLPRGRVDGAGGVALAVTAQEGAASGAHSVLLCGPDPRGLLTAAGYRTRAWRGVPAGAGALALVARDTPRLHPAPVPGVAGLRRAAMGAVRRLTAPVRLTVASRTPGPPALCQAQQGSAAYVVTGGGGPRRRPVLVVGDDGRPSRVVKVARPADAERGVREQGLLTSLQEQGSGGPVPVPLGHGQAGRFAWSAESAVPGRPLADLLGERAARVRVRQVLDEVAAWLTALAAGSRVARSWGTGPDPGAVLLGEHAPLGSGFARLAGVPGVLVHGDLAAAFNLLVDDESWAVLDWETAQQHGLPLLDLLPLLCAALASRERRDPAEQAAYVLRLCAGQEVDSDWLLTQVSRYLTAAGVRDDAAGALAALAFGHQASMRLAHARLVQDAGDEPPRWRSLWDDVARGWCASPDLGWDWPALRRHRSGALG